MSYVLGLTGSIGMGKSTTANLIKSLGVPVWDADAYVHQLYAKDGQAVKPIADLCPTAIKDGAVDRDQLRAEIAQNPALLEKVQALVHPMVAANRARFIAASAAPIIVLDIPLLYEIGADRFCDGVLVVTAPHDVQKQRVMQRNISELEFQMILSRQMPDAEKRARATWVVETLSIPHVESQLRSILGGIRRKLGHA
jgi:dephospho-CoA kinase